MSESQHDAQARNPLRYFTGVPCKHGHVAERWVLSGACCECGRLAYERRMAKLGVQTREAERVTGLRGWRARQAYIQRFGGFTK